MAKHECVHVAVPNFYMLTYLQTEKKENSRYP